VIERRAFLRMVSGSLLAAPRVVQAQQATSVPRVGFLNTASLSDPRVPPFLQAFRQGLRELGYVEDQNIALELRWAEGQYDRLPGLAAELVRLKVNIIVAAGPSAVQAAKQVTDAIPMVMPAVADPVAMGFVASLARPGGNITGISNMQPELVGKQIELLKEVLPKVSRVALLGNPANPGNVPLVRYAQGAARTSRGPSRPTSRSGSRPSSNSLSTSRPPKRSAWRSRRHSSCGRIR
jgi:ABC-type uncharacterized transport system substrate-binding protein